MFSLFPIILNELKRRMQPRSRGLQCVLRYFYWHIQHVNTLHIHACTLAAFCPAIHFIESELLFVEVKNDEKKGNRNNNISIWTYFF